MLLTAALGLALMAIPGQSAFADATSTNFKTDEVTLSPGESVDITVETFDVDATVNGVSINIQHPDSLTVTGPACTGIFTGGLVLSGSVPGGTTIGCVLITGAVGGTSGDVMSFTLTRDGDFTTDQTVSMLLDELNPLATQFQDPSGRIGPGTTNQIIVRGPVLNQTPEANAGPDQNVQVGDTVNLDGSGSSDADGDDLTLSWTLTPPDGSTASLSGAETASPSFVADLAGTYEAVLVVNDGALDSEPDSVSIQAAQGNTAPVANAGPDQNVQVGDTVNLDGSGSNDADDLTFSWTLTAPDGSTASLSGAETASPSFVADLAGTYEAVLVVNDGALDSEPDSVSITAGEFTTLFSDDFNRPDNPEVGNDWFELEETGATVSVAGEKLSFDDTSDAARRPVVSRDFTSVSTGTLQWDFDFDWTRTNPDPDYELWMQLGDGAQMVAPSGSDSNTRFTGAAVVLRWGSFDSTDQSLVARQDPTMGGAISLGPISGPTHLSVTADLGSKTYSVSIDGTVVGSDLSFDNVETVSTLNRVRFFTDSLDEQNFSGRTFDNLIITIPGAGDSLPVADAGPDQQVQTGATVTLDGSGSTDAGGNDLAFSWTLTGLPEESTADLTGADTATPSFVADRTGTYEAQLVVNNGTADSAPDTVTIEATAGGENSAPVANAGEDQVVETGDTVTLDGSGSTDADGDDLTYRWRLTSVPEGSTLPLTGAATDPLTGADTANPSFVPDVAGTYEVELVVNDGTADSEPDTVAIEAIEGGENSAPVANAGEDQVVETGDTVTLDGSGSTDADGDDLTYRWRLTTVPEGSTLPLTGAATDPLTGAATDALTGADTANPSFVPDVAGTYEVELVVNDGTADSEPDTVTIVAFDQLIGLPNPGQFAILSAPTLLSETPTVLQEDPEGSSLLMIYAGSQFLIQGEPGFDEEIVKPVTAFYITASSNATVGLNFAEITGPGQSSRTLDAGWNLIGTNRAAPAQDELSTIQSTVATGGIVTLHVPNFHNGNKSEGHEDWESDGDRDLNANPITQLPERNLSDLDGYWVFLDSPRTYSKILTPQ